MSGPARGYSWPPFEAGNFAAKRHGATSPRVVAPVAAELAEALIEAAPWCSGAAFSAEVESWSWAEARCRLLRVWLDERGFLDEDGVPRPALAELHRAESAAARGRQQLGLSPAAWAKLLSAFSTAGADAEGVLEHLTAQGRKVLEARGSE